MKRNELWKISVVTTAEAEDAVAESLTNLLGNAANTHTDLRTGRITVSTFSETRPVARISREWKFAVERLKLFGLSPGPAKMRIEKIQRENWAESWKRHFKPLAIGNSLLVKPSWIKQQPKRGQAVVVLDPGLSFGTGQHPTTLFCLRELVRRRRPGKAQAFLDIGTGSGILAIAAAKLGYAPVHAFDYDPESVRVARGNAKLNGVEKKLRIARKDLTKLPRKSLRSYDVACANLISTLLMAEAKRIGSHVKSAGHLVVAGILKQEFLEVERAFSALGFKLVARKSGREWTSGTLAKGNQAGKALV